MDFIYEKEGDALPFSHKCPKDKMSSMQEIL